MVRFRSLVGNCSPQASLSRRSGHSNVIARAHISSSGYSGLAFQGTVAGGVQSGVQSIVTAQDIYPALADQRVWFLVTTSRES